MKRNAFTLVELLVVMSVILLLVAVLAPTVDSARGLARSNICQKRLKDLGTAFGMAKATREDANAAGLRYPRSSDWPGVPFTVFKEPDAYICPEEPPETVTTQTQVGQNSLNRVRYYSPNPAPGVLFTFTDPPYAISRRGVENGRGYTEYIVENDGSVATWDRDDDGIWRLWDPGKDGKVKFELVHYHCTWLNGLYLDGQPKFKHPFTPLSSIVLEFSGVYTSYGINKQSEKLDPSSNRVLLLDYTATIADPTNTADFQSRLDNSARHVSRSKINVLFGDMSVKSFGPTELKTRTDLWQP